MKNLDNMKWYSSKERPSGARDITIIYPDGKILGRYGYGRGYWNIERDPEVWNEIWERMSGKEFKWTYTDDLVESAWPGRKKEED